MQPGRTREYFYIQTEEFLSRTWQWLAQGCQEHTALQEEWGTVCLEKGMAEVLIGRRPAQSEAEAGQGSWYPSVTCCYFLQQHIFIGCCTQDLILHSEMGLAAASSPLASILSGKKVCLILFSFLLLHSFRGEQASSPPFPIGKRRFRHGWWVRFACEVVVGQSLSVNLFSVTHCIIKGQNGICKV